MNDDIRRAAMKAIALATINGNLAQLVVCKRDTSIPWKVSALREYDETWADLLAHGAVAQDKAGTP